MGSYRVVRSSAMKLAERFYLIKTVVTQKLECQKKKFFIFNSRHVRREDVMTEELEYQKKKSTTLLLNLRGFVLMVIASVLFGTSANVTKILFQAHNITPQWIVAFRALVVGIVLYVLLRPPFPRKHILRLFFYTIVGFTGFQIFYYLAIAYSNATIALLLQFLCIPLMVLYETVIYRQHLSRTKIAVIFLSVIGTALLSFGDGHGFRLIISPLALLFGLLTAITAAIYPLAGVSLVREYGAWHMT